MQMKLSNEDVGVAIGGGKRESSLNTRRFRSNAMGKKNNMRERKQWKCNVRVPSARERPRGKQSRGLGTNSRYCFRNNLPRTQFALSATLIVNTVSLVGQVGICPTSGTEVRSKYVVMLDTQCGLDFLS